MPWHLVPNHRECGRGKVAVVKDADGSVVACHPNEEAARKHMAALYANEPGAGRSLEGRAAIGSHSTATTDVPWDANANRTRLPNSRAALRAAHAWVDPDGDPDAKSSYRFIHHMVAGGGRVGAANTRAASTGIGVLNGGRGGTTIPTGDRSGVYNHLAAHLRAANMEPPDLQGGGRSYEEVGMAAVERRYTYVTVELRAAGDSPRIGGYAAVFDKPSQNLGGFIEQYNRSFFNKSRGDGWPDVICRFDHENAFLLGTTAARTLELRLDEMGLDYLVDPPKARADIVELVQRGDVRKSSCAFRVPPGGDDWSLSDQGFPMRTLLTGQLVDVAPVISPAYLDTTSGLRSLASKFDADPEEVRSLAAENELRRFFVKTEAGMPAAKPKRRLSGAAALARVLERETPQL